jgi:DMSO/TMAO reductase YedYZ heme-binding membrane subunit
VAATGGRARNRYRARAGAPGPVAEHRSKIMAVLVAGVAVIVLVLSMTREGHVIDAATQRFMLYYAGVFALIALTASVGVGLVATDRIVLTPGHRVMAQAVHRAVSFGALTFLIVHITTEILAQRVHVIDAFVPFLSPFRTFYIGLGTIASDLILLLVITSIIRKRFTAHGKAWRWRAIHYTSYLSFIFGIVHGLLGGRTAKPYVDWSYGFCIALVALALVVRYLAISLRPKESLSVPPARAAGSTSPLRAAALPFARAQLGGTVQVLPAGAGAGAASRVQIGASPMSGFMPLGAPPYGDDMGYGQPAVAGPPPAPSAGSRQPLYEPGYVGPPRYEGAPRGGTGPMPRIADSGPIPRVADSGPMPRLTHESGTVPRIANSGPMPRMMDSGPIPRVVDSGPIPRIADSGPIPRIADSGPMPRVADSGPMPRIDTGPLPRVGPLPRAATGPMPRGGSGPMPTAGRGPGQPQVGPGRRPGRHPASQYPPGPPSPGQNSPGQNSSGPYPSDPYPAGQPPYGQPPDSGPVPGQERRPRRAQHTRPYEQGPPDPGPRDQSRRRGDTWR